MKKRLGLMFKILGFMYVIVFEEGLKYFLLFEEKCKVVFKQFNVELSFFVIKVNNFQKSNGY